MENNNPLEITGENIRDYMLRDDFKFSELLSSLRKCHFLLLTNGNILVGCSFIQSNMNEDNSGVIFKKFKISVQQTSEKKVDKAILLTSDGKYSIEFKIVKWASSLEDKTLKVFLDNQYVCAGDTLVFEEFSFGFKCAI